MKILQTSCVVLAFTGAIASAQTPEAVPANNLLKNASFEEPKIEGRLDWTKGGVMKRLADDTSWAHYQSKDRTGALTVGLTNELARTGKQAIYIDFKKAGKTRDAFLMTELVPIKGEQEYRISIWGRLDRKRPITLVGSRPLLQVEVEFFQADLETQTGDTQYRNQQIPGSPRRILFQTEKWNEYYTDVKSPEDAAFMKVSFRWQATGEDGEANGMIYFDDAVISGPPGTPAPSEAAEPVPTAPAPSAAPPAPGAPAAPR